MADSRAQGRIALLAAAVLLLCTGLSATDFWAPDEPRYGQIAEEIRSFEHGPQGLVLMHLGGDPYTQKPPLYYWLAALAGAVSGHVSEAAARLPSALAGVATVGLVYAIARRMFVGPWAPLLSGLVLLTTFRFAHSARRAQLDVLLTLFETLALYAFWRIEASRDRQAPAARDVALLHGALGAAALTKGPVGWIPFVAIAVYLLWGRRGPSLRALVPAWSLLLSVAPVCLWIAGATWLAPSGFFSEAVVANLLERFVEAESHVRPPWYYLYQLPADFLPWTLAWPLVALFAFRSTRSQGALPASWRLLVAWIGVPLLVFSLSSGKRGLYLLPAFPALALMVGAALDGWLRERGVLPRTAETVLATLALAVGCGGAWIAWSGGLDSVRHPGFGVSAESAGWIGAFAFLGLVTGLLARRARPSTGTLAVTAATLLAIELVVFLRVYPAQDDQKSPRPVALQAAALTRPDERVGIFDDEGLAGGILYYGDRRVEILPRPRHVAEFLANGGRYLVLERWKLPWLEPVGSFEVHATSRRDRRQLAVVSLHTSSQGSP